LTRLVIDASALLSGIASNPERPPGLLLAALYERAFEPVVCPKLLGEVRRGLHRGYFRKRVPEHDIERIVLTIARASVQLRDPKNPPPLLRDPTDDYLVARSHERLAHERSSPGTRTCSTIRASIHQPSPCAPRVSCSAWPEPPRVWYSPLVLPAVYESRERLQERQKPRKSARLFSHSGGGIRTRDLRVMSPTSYQTAPPRGVDRGL
jgi:uncharacterized protein